MGKKIDALLGRNFKTSKFKALVNFGLSRLTVLKNQRQARCNIARSDVVGLLNLGHHDRALLRVEHVIKEKNMLEVFIMIEGYCQLVIERVDLIEHERVCPDELKEAIASLLYASTRCGEFPELQEIREVFISRFGKEFVARAVELRNNCGVNPKMLQKLSTRQPTLEIRLKVLKEIASENNIVLQVEEEPSSETTESQPKPDPSASSGSQIIHDENENMDRLTPRRYRDVADAAQAAFESAAYAAEAARAAVELSQYGPHDPDDHPSHTTHTPRRYISNAHEPTELGSENVGAVLGFEKMHPIARHQAETGDEKFHDESKTEEFSKSGNGIEFKRSVSGSSSNSGDSILEGAKTEPSEKVQPEMVFDKSDDESGIEPTHDLVSNKKSSLVLNEVSHSEKSNRVRDEDQLISHSEKSNRVRDEDQSEGRGESLYNSSRKQFRLKSKASLKVESGPEKPKVHLKAEERPISVRTRWARRR